MISIFRKVESISKSSNKFKSPLFSCLCKVRKLDVDNKLIHIVPIEKEGKGSSVVLDEFGRINGVQSTLMLLPEEGDWADVCSGKAFYVAEDAYNEMLTKGFYKRAVAGNDVYDEAVMSPFDVTSKVISVSFLMAGAVVESFLAGCVDRKEGKDGKIMLDFKEVVEVEKTVVVKDYELV